jgi:hypothetical protein
MAITRTLYRWFCSQYGNPSGSDMFRFCDHGRHSGSVGFNLLCSQTCVYRLEGMACTAYRLNPLMLMIAIFHMRLVHTMCLCFLTKTLTVHKMRRCKKNNPTYAMDVFSSDRAFWKSEWWVWGNHEITSQELIFRVHMSQQAILNGPRRRKH